MSDWVRALGIDYGTAGIGVSVSDDLGFLAHPLETVPGSDSEKAAARIAELVRLRPPSNISWSVCRSTATGRKAPP